MKKRAFISYLTSALAISLVLSCNTGKDKKEEEKPADSTTVKKEIPSGPAHRLLVRHKVKDFANWLVGYEAHDSTRLANGIHSFAVGRGLSDSNMVQIIMKVDDVEKAKAFSTSADLKEVMKKAGVISEPSAEIVEDIYNDDATATQEQNRMMVRHQVKDFDAWKQSFDSHKQVRTDAGLTDRVIARSVDNKNDVTVVTVVSDLAKAKAFATSKDLKDKMKEAGVEGAPDVFFYRIVKKY